MQDDDLTSFLSAHRAGKRRPNGEVPFRCPAHDDRHASASYNAIKEVWNCLGCGAKGTANDLRRRLGLR
jgi:hypothetical protein